MLTPRAHASVWPPLRAPVQRAAGADRKGECVMIRLPSAVPALSLAIASAAVAQPYRVTDLVSDTGGAAHTDTALVNAWGIAFNPQGFVWVADNGTGKSTLYNGLGVPQSLIVSIPSVTNSEDPGSPTGIVFTGGDDFVVTQGSASGPARFIFATENGSISAWSPQVDMTHAIIMVDDSDENNIYKGLAVAPVGNSHRLYATDFHNNRVEVYDGSFGSIEVPGHFADPTIPPRFAPFGIQTIGDRIYVTYAMQDANAEDEIDGPGLGYVNAFTVDGFRIARIASRGELNAPWGIALAPQHFGQHSNELLIGNFGDGRINAFSSHRSFVGVTTYRSEGPLRARGHAITIDGLWGIAFGNGLQNQPRDTLFFAAGPQHEGHGLYGRIDH